MQTVKFARVRTNMALVWLASVGMPRKSATTFQFKGVGARHGRMSRV